MAHDVLPVVPAPHPEDPYIRWAELLWRTRDIDGVRFPRCGGSMRLLDVVTDPADVEEILGRRKLPAPTRVGKGADAEPAG